MPDRLDQNGLVVKTANEIVNDLEAGMRGIYGADINVDQNSPDGQLINIYGQEAVDLRELLVLVNNSFDPDRAVGRTLDERVVINNIIRNGSTYTIIDIEITTDRTVTLQGLDGAFNDINGVGFTVQDNAGNRFILIDTVTLVAGTHSLPFRARQIGRVETTIGTITQPVTVVLGVTAINNPTGATTTGQNEETDAQLRVRRSRSVANASTGYLNGLQGVIASLSGVTDVRIYENFTNVTDDNGIPPHAIWTIVDGGANIDIANAIYERKSYGCDLKGDVVVPIQTPSGQSFLARFDRPEAVNLYIQFDIKRTSAIHVFDLDYIRNFIADAVMFGIGEFAETSRITAAAVSAIAGQGSGGVPINVEISDDDYTWVDYLDVTTLDKKWVVAPENINITVIS